jgi:polyisoprenoid-binding protein YceI
MSVSIWKLDPAHSLVEFSVKHMMFTNVRGSFGDVEGTVKLDTEAPEDSSVEVTIGAGSLDTGVEDRDNHLRSADFLNADAHPHLTFKSRRVEGSLAEAGDSFKVVGDLTIRGVTREVVLDARFEGTGADPWGGTRSGFSARTRIDRRDFGLTWNQALETGGVLVGHEVKIDLEIQAVRVEEEAMAGAGAE